MLRCRGLGEFSRGPDDHVHLTTELAAHVLHDFVERRRSWVSDDEQVDIARWVVESRNVRTEQEGEIDTGILLQRRGQPQRDAACPHEEVAKGDVERMFAIDPPEPKAAEPATAQNAARFEALERPLRCVRICFGPANDLVRVQLLPRRRREERQDSGGCLTPNKWMPVLRHFL